MPSNQRRIAHLGIGIVLLAFLLAGLPLAAHAAPPGQKYREDGALGLTPVGLPPYRQVCTGSSIPLTFVVKNVSPGLEIPLPVVEAMVTVSDDQGKVRALVTNGAGVASFSWPAPNEGTLNFTVVAEKEYYLPAAPIHLQIEVKPCRWMLKVSFREEYAIMSEVNMVVGATTHWTGSLTSTQRNAEDAISDIQLAGGEGQFQFYASDQIEAPVHVSLDPAVSGEYSLKAQGTSDGRTINLNIGTNPVKYPLDVTFKLTDYSNQGIQIKYQPPVPIMDGNGMFIESNHLNDLTFPASGGIIHLDSGMSCYFSAPERTQYDLSILLISMSSDIY